METQLDKETPARLEEELQSFNGAAEPEESEDDALLEKFANQDYKWGFSSDVAADEFEPGLSEEVVKRISEKKGEPQWLLDWRLKAYRHFLTMKEPRWPNVKYAPVDLQDVIFYSAPKLKPVLNSLDEADPEMLRAFQKLGIPLEEQKVLLNVKGAAPSAADARGINPATQHKTDPTDPSDPSDLSNPSETANGQPPTAHPVAIDAVFDSISVVTTYKEKLAELGIIFCSISEAVQEHPDLVKQYLGSVVPYSDNYYATLNSAVFSDGSFVYVPKGVRCPMELSTYFRINAKNTGQFERTLIIADEGAYVSYLEGC